MIPREPPLPYWFPAAPSFPWSDVVNGFGPHEACWVISDRRWSDKRLLCGFRPTTSHRIQAPPRPSVRCRIVPDRSRQKPKSPRRSCCEVLGGVVGLLTVKVSFPLTFPSQLIRCDRTGKAAGRARERLRLGTTCDGDVRNVHESHGSCSSCAQM